MVDELQELIEELGESAATKRMAVLFFDAMEFTDGDQIFNAPTVWATKTPARRALQFSPRTRDHDGEAEDPGRLPPVW